MPVKGAATVSDAAGSTGPRPVPFGLSSFQGYPVERSLSSAGGEADIYVIRDGAGSEYVLRLFRQGREPKPEVFGRLAELSARLGGMICQTYRTGRDEASGKWFEIQEYVRQGDLAGIFAGGPVSDADFRELARQLSKALDALHREGVVHRDVKPDNILVRSRKPLAVALADFGISSLLAPGVSVKGTRAANTPLYSAPESFADFAGAAGDFWSLGAVLLEGVAGRHPLAGLSVNQVMREISLRGLRVPPSVKGPQAALLKGLLTRDDRRRWGAAEVARWLAGERDIEVYYEAPDGAAGGGAEAGAPGAGRRAPYRFRGRAYATSAELAEAFESSEEDWAQGREHLARGYLRSHMEESGRAEGLRLVGRIESMGLGPDESLFAFVQNFSPKSRHVWRGLPLTRKGVLELLDARLEGPEGRAGIGGAAAGPRGGTALGAPRVRGGQGAAGRKQGPAQGAADLFMDDVLKGRLAALPDIARKAGHPFDRVMEALLAYGAPVAPEALRSGLDASVNPEAFVWGFREPPPPGPDALLFALAAGAPLMTWNRFWSLVPRRAVIPREIIERFSEPGDYDAGARLLELMASSGALASGVGGNLPGLVPWKAAAGRVKIADASLEELLDAAEALKEDGRHAPEPVKFGGRKSPGRRGGPESPGSSGGPAGPGFPGGPEATGPPVRRPLGVQDIAGAGPAEAFFWRMERWLRRELDPFYGPGFTSVNALPAVLALLLSGWFFGLSGVFGGSGEGYLAFRAQGLMNYIMSVAGLACSAALALPPTWRHWDWKGAVGISLLLAVFFLYMQSFPLYCAKASAAYLLGLYFINRFRHRLRSHAARRFGF
ncbi:MAG: protein kinase [Deltaproteobacteria bacterium]|nr:protein kinase [Deltaproteobacteria bacterium]